MPDYTKDLRPLTPNEQAIHDAIGYDPVRVSMPGGIGGLTYRTADDMDNLIACIAPLLDAKDKELAKSDRAFNKVYDENGKLHLRVMELELLALRIPLSYKQMLYLIEVVRADKAYHRHMDEQWEGQAERDKEKKLDFIQKALDSGLSQEAVAEFIQLRP